LHKDLHKYWFTSSYIKKPGQDVPENILAWFFDTYIEEFFHG